MQKAKKTKPSQRSFLAPLRFGHDLLEEVMRIIQEQGIQHASISIIGAVTGATFGYYDQEAHEYLTIKREGPFEVLSCTGNVTFKQGSPFVHAHALFGDRSGGAFGGHLMSPSIIFAAEIYMQELSGRPPERIQDPATGLYLWPQGTTAQRS
ncbi:MAG: DNA-binding protein [Deltaproteobacteria bacterium]|nr:DNA-binding protein [Deltaproteobacteria bacterium]